MLSVIPIADALNLVLERFGSKTGRVEYVRLQEALDRYLGADVIAQEDVPAFDRSTVDGFAVRSADLRGCSDSIPAILQKTGESIMGHAYDIPLTPGTCVYVPTGGAVPPEADAMVMLEYTEDFGGDQFAFYKPVPPGANLILRGEDLRQGEAILKSGKKTRSGGYWHFGCTRKDRSASFFPTCRGYHLHGRRTRRARRKPETRADPGCQF